MRPLIARSNHLIITYSIQHALLSKSDIQPAGRDLDAG